MPMLVIYHILPLYSHCIPIVFPLQSHCIPIAFPLYSDHILTIFPYAPIIHPLYTHYIPLIFPVYFRYILIMFKYIYTVHIYIYPHYIPMIFPLESNGFCHCFLTVSSSLTACSSLSSLNVELTASAGISGSFHRRRWKLLSGNVTSLLLKSIEHVPFIPMILVIYL